MSDQPLEISKSLIDEIIISTGLAKSEISRALYWPLFHKLTDRLGDLLVRFDNHVKDEGLPDASEWLLKSFCDQVKARGNEKVPCSGPLLVATNHPGTIDGLVVFSNLHREDILWISNDIPAMHLFPNIQKHIVFASRKKQADNFIAMRDAIQHLRHGGALVYIASGGRDPDPAVYTGAELYIDRWLDSFDAFFKYVPGLRIQPAMVSHVVSPVWAKHPVTWLRRSKHWKLILAEFSQVLFQLENPGKLMLSPAISFGDAFSEAEIRAEAGEDSLRLAIIETGKRLLKEHRANFACAPFLNGI
jgi:hypothetical protein